jgi:hypothetical protein
MRTANILNPLRRHPWVVFIIVLFVSVGCGLSATPTATPTPEPAPTATPTPVLQPTATPLPTPPRTPEPTLEVPADTDTPIRHLTDEELREELKTARFSTGEWNDTYFHILSVDLKEFRGGGPGKDDIPAIDDPDFTTVEEADDWLSGREPVQVVNINGDVRAYPLQILIWHEIVNDVVGGEPVSVTY